MIVRAPGHVEEREHEVGIEGDGADVWIVRHASVTAAAARHVPAGRALFGQVER